MKKSIKLMCIALVLYTTTMAQQANTQPVAQQKSKEKLVAKITFPPNFARNPDGSAICKVVGTTEEGVIMENAQGQKILVTSDNKVTTVEATKNWTPLPKQQNQNLKLIGTTDTGTLVWEDPKGNKCTIDLKTGKQLSHKGHVTLLK